MPINTSKLADTALATAVGVKHIVNQNQANYQSAYDAETKATEDVRQQQNERAVAQDIYNNAALEYNQAEVDRPSTDIQADIDNNKRLIDENTEKYTKYNSQFENPDGSPTGVTPTKGQQSYLTKLTNKKAMLLKAQESLQMEQDTRAAMLRGVMNKKGILENKTKDLEQSRANQWIATENKALAEKKFGVKTGGTK